MEVVKFDRENKQKTLGRLFWHQNWQLARCVERCAVFLPCPTSRRVYTPTRPVSLIQNGGNYERQSNNARKKRGNSIYDVITFLPPSFNSTIKNCGFHVANSDEHSNLYHSRKRRTRWLILFVTCETHARDSQKKLSSNVFSRVAIFAYIGRSPV